MDEQELTALINAVQRGELDPADAVAALRRLPYADLGFARVDHHRQLRQGMPEAVYGPGKAPEHCARIVAELLERGSGPVLLTRASDVQLKAVLAVDDRATVTPTVKGTALVAWRAAPPADTRTLLVITAGTADLPVAAETRATLDAYGWTSTARDDCGVAGIHRLLAHVDEIADADAVVVVAGMEGALPSVVAGLTSAPVIAVPTSVGYGAALEGVTALLAMLSACAPGITVVGIDNGYGAACAVARALGGIPRPDRQR